MVVFGLGIVFCTLRVENWLGGCLGFCTCLPAGLFACLPVCALPARRRGGVTRVSGARARRAGGDTRVAARVRTACRTRGWRHKGGWCARVRARAPPARREGGETGVATQWWVVRAWARAPPARCEGGDTRVATQGRLVRTFLHYVYMCTPPPRPLNQNSRWLFLGWELFFAP